MAIEIDTMKWVDRHIGSPICYVLTLVEKARRFMIGNAAVTDPALKRILFVELSEMGSMVAACPVLRNFRRRHPESGFYFLTFKQNRACLDVLKLVPPENVITIETDSLFRFVGTTLRAIRTMRSLRLDAVVDFELFSRISSILCYLAGAKRSVGYHRMSLEGLYRGDLHTHPVGYNHYAHISGNFASLLNALDGGRREHSLLKERIDLPVVPIERPPLDESRRVEVWRKLQSLCPELMPHSRVIVMNPNAGNLLPIRAWPLRNYIELTRRLLRDPDCCVVIMGTSEASADAARISEEAGSTRLVDLTGRTTFEDLVPLLSLGDLLLTNDSGPAHFAALTDTAILVFFGPETPDLYKPLSDKCHAFYSRYHCSPCLNAYNHRTTTCTNNLCLQVITVDEVEQKVRECLDAYPVVARP